MSAGSTPDGLAEETGGRAVRIEVRVQPRARKDALTGVHDGRLKLAVAAPPEDGRANAAAAALLAELFGLAPSSVELVRGHSSRAKVFRLPLALATARARLARLLSR